MLPGALQVVLAQLPRQEVVVVKVIIGSDLHILLFFFFFFSIKEHKPKMMSVRPSDSSQCLLKTDRLENKCNKSKKDEEGAHFGFLFYDTTRSLFSASQLLLLRLVEKFREKKRSFTYLCQHCRLQSFF